VATVNRKELVAAADNEGIRRESYSLEGGMPPGQYVLAVEDGGWSVYYSERRQRVDEQHFETEDEACSHLLMWLVSDPTTRRDPT